MLEILIVEDDKVLSDGIVLALKQNNYHFTQCYDITSADMQLQKKEFDLIILDINLPDGSGYDLCKETRKNKGIPIIILSANDMESDVVTGLELGADDYITKPFSLMILRARVNAQLRRLDHGTVSSQYRKREFVFDFDKMEFIKGNEKIELSKTEQKLLRMLVDNKGVTLSRSSLVDKIWTDGAEYVDENALSVSIKRLRDKLEDTPSRPKYIKTVYGIGYVWAENENE